ncbi:MAG: hypothetical protein A3G18_09545 [Rhodospirillales bacterium RIFCSPLOWO2_12_FULL_58_28]|nr:MAG: hypothetical protein A3G18_09545 [Rhodospirillales bacterium RIFCSPLOWO2_12_FULL_58_28]
MIRNSGSLFMQRGHEVMGSGLAFCLNCKRSGVTALGKRQDLTPIFTGRELKGAALTRFMESVTKVDYQLSYLAEDAAETRVAGAEVTPR